LDEAKRFWGQFALPLKIVQRLLESGGLTRLCTLMGELARLLAAPQRCLLIVDLLSNITSSFSLAFSQLLLCRIADEEKSDSHQTILDQLRLLASCLETVLGTLRGRHELPAHLKELLKCLFVKVLGFVGVRGGLTFPGQPTLLPSEND